MNTKRSLGLIRYFLVVGLLATIAMDLCGLALVKTGIVQLGAYQIVPGLLGRWVGSFATGRFFHTTILETPALAHEKVFGVASHYLIGLTLSSILLYPTVGIMRRPVSLRIALLFGLGTCVLPWFVMFPAMGLGVMGCNLPHAYKFLLFSFLNHIAFGAGIFFWSNLWKLRRLKNDLCDGFERAPGYGSAAVQLPQCNSADSYRAR